MSDPVARALSVLALQALARIERKLDHMTEAISTVDDGLAALDTAMGNLEPAVVQELAFLTDLKNNRGGTLAPDQEAKFQALVAAVNQATADLLTGAGATPAGAETAAPADATAETAPVSADAPAQEAAETPADAPASE